MGLLTASLYVRLPKGHLHVWLKRWPSSKVRRSFGFSLRTLSKSFCAKPHTRRCDACDGERLACRSAWLQLRSGTSNEHSRRVSAMSFLSSPSVSERVSSL